MRVLGQPCEFQVEGGAGAGGAEAAAACKEQRVREELAGLKLRALIKRAEDLGLPDEEIEAAEAKAPLIELLLPALLEAGAAEVRKGSTLEFGK